MLIKDLLNQGTPSFSFEFFPPKTDEAFDTLMETIRELQKLHPTFVSVTYGAGGSTRRRTIDVVAKAKGELGQESMAHLTCVGSTEEELRDVLDELRTQGIENVLPLRGDPPAGTDVFEKTPGGFGYANELVSFIKENYDFCLGVAGYPEGHQEADDFDTDLANLKLKVDAGADFVITQMFFDNRFYFDFVVQARAIGIDVPLIPGIMPILNLGQIKRFTQMCGASIPEELLERLEAIKEDADAVRQCGVEHAAQQCRELLEGGVPGIHFYTLNRSTSTRDIFENLKAVGALA
jgi:methylenetetrahydrofolate reductase (NADPH)